MGNNSSRCWIMVGWHASSGWGQERTEYIRWFHHLWALLLLVRGRAREHQLPRPRDGLGSRSCSRASITKTTGKPCTVLQYPSKKEQTLVFRGGEAKVRPSLFSAFLGLEKRLIRLFLAFFLFVLNPPNGKIKSTKNIDASEQSLTTYIYSYSQHIYIHTHNIYIFNIHYVATRYIHWELRRPTHRRYTCTKAVYVQYRASRLYRWIHVSQIDVDTCAETFIYA